MWNGSRKDVFPSGIETAKRIKTHAANPIRVKGINRTDGMPRHRRSAPQLAIEIIVDFASVG
jgi:hypothetical protein